MTGVADSSHPMRFRLTLIGLFALLVALPILAVTVFGIDSRTPVSIAEDTLHDKYGLETVSASGEAIAPDTTGVTISEFSVEAGATTEDVPFSLDGTLVHCTIHVPSSDPASVTADCSAPAAG